MNREKIVCIGDSLTAGYGIPTKHRWTDLLGNNLSIDIINSGISGDTTAGMLARFYQMAIQHKPNYIIITGGTNDISLNISNNHIISNILAMTRYAKHHDIIPIIGIPTPIFDPENSAIDPLLINGYNFSKRINVFQKTLKQFSKDDNQKIVDFTANMTSNLFLEDGIHPNKLGHKQMAKNALESNLNFTSAYLNHNE
ncbi:MAG: GDSL-type esterase/lipase family protein [Crocinitomicaceae bacterium]|nr:GDSL-type esterase/lipase family protein [Crocinitomicaceae bacterium]